jgi:hypothetical protein
MYRLFPQMALTATLATFALAQAPPPKSDTDKSASYRGILMDASCKAIQSRSITSINKESAAAAAATSATTTSTTGVSTDQAAQATATNRTTPTSNPSLKVYDGNTGGPAVKDATGAAPTGERSRAADPLTDPQWTKVRETYKDCKVTPTTSSFAIMSNGQLYMVDDTSGTLRHKMSANTSSDWAAVTLMGTKDGDRIRASSIR